MYNYPTYSQYQNPYNSNYYNNYNQMAQQQQTFQGGLSGRMVANETEIMANEVSMNGNASYFPVADGSQIIVKKWNANGLITTQIYRLDTPIENTEIDNLPQSNIKSLEETFRTFRDDIFAELETIKSSITTNNSKKPVRKEVNNE